MTEIQMQQVTKVYISLQMKVEKLVESIRLCKFLNINKAINS
jgi:hypothetical protein